MQHQRKKLHMFRWSPHWPVCMKGTQQKGQAPPIGTWWMGKKVHAGVLSTFCKELAVGLQCILQVGVRHLPWGQAPSLEAQMEAQRNPARPSRGTEGLRRSKRMPTGLHAERLPENGFFWVSTPQITMAKLKEKLGISWCCSLGFDKNFQALSCHLTGAQTKYSDI